MDQTHSILFPFGCTTITTPTPTTTTTSERGTTVLRVSDTPHAVPGDAEISRAHLCRHRLRCLGFALPEQAGARASACSRAHPRVIPEAVGPLVAVHCLGLRRASPPHHWCGSRVLVGHYGPLFILGREYAARGSFLPWIACGRALYLLHYPYKARVGSRPPRPSTLPLGCVVAVCAPARPRPRHD